ILRSRGTMRSSARSRMRPIYTSSGIRLHPTASSLVQRATADLAPLIDAMWGAGYYNGRVSVLVAGMPLALPQDHRGAAAAAANAYRNRGTVPIRVIAETGPRFKLRD